MNPEAKRFTGRVEAYRRYRPRYPGAVLDFLRARCGLSPRHVIADVGCGTGLSSELFLENGNPVMGIEPNGEMRAACTSVAERFPAFSVRGGTAEDTGLDDRAADFVVVAQAFHWFDLDRARAEFRRVLNPGGWAVVLWNRRQKTGDEFHERLEEIAERFGTDYEDVKARQPSDGHTRAFLGPETYISATTANAQYLDAEGLAMRFASCSYVPNEGDPGFGRMVAAIGELHGMHARDGIVELKYLTEIHAGQLR